MKRLYDLKASDFTDSKHTIRVKWFKYEIAIEKNYFDGFYTYAGLNIELSGRFYGSLKDLRTFLTDIIKTILSGQYKEV